MQQVYVVRPLAGNDYSALGVRFGVYEVLPGSARIVALCREEADARLLCKALQFFGETDTKPLGAPPASILVDPQS